nr:hypothetical protein CKG001_24050 [Bdellovibrio sp. CKG001]
MLLRLLVLFAAMSALTAQGATYSPVLRDGGSRFLVRSLGSVCYSMDSFRRGLPCNPAFVAKDKAPRFDVDLMLGSNMEYLREAEELLNGKSDEQGVAKIFSRREMVDGEISIEASFQRPTWGVSIEPYRLVYVYQFENAALPMVELIASEEQSLKAQLASFTSGNFYAGLQLRYTHIKYIGNSFSIAEAMAGDNEKLFEIHNQDILYVEPGILYAWEDAVWEPQISAMLSQWGVSSKKSEQYPIRPQGLLGASLKPTVPMGLLEVGMQVQIHNETKNFQDAVRAAITYQLGLLQAVVSGSQYDQSAGFLATYKSFSTGLSYWSERQNKSVFVQFGVSL